jgi:hypothetical protein
MQTVTYFVINMYNIPLQTRGRSDKHCIPIYLFLQYTPSIPFQIFYKDNLDTKKTRIKSI